MWEDFLDFIGLGGDEEDGYHEDFSIGTDPAVVDGELTAVDMDGDGIEDTFTMQHFVDTDGDGRVDTVVTEMMVDSDQDSHPDYYSVIEESDTDGDGIIDQVTLSEDYNGDLMFDAVTEWEDHDADGRWDMSFYPIGEPVGVEAYDVYEHFDSSEDGGDGIVGDPGDAMESWHPQAGNTCAVVSQEFVLEQLLDREFDEDELREIAEDNGWYNNGTSAEDVGRLLEYYGVHTEQSTGNSLQDLRDSLADGNQVIVSVDSEELWSGQNEELFGPGMDADHAIQVIGIDESDPDHVMVIINDSGVANGQGVMVPADAFMDAWEDGGCFMVEAFADGLL